MKTRAILSATVIAATVMLTACGKSPAWHVGHCSAGQLDAQGLSAMPRAFINNAFNQVAANHGFSVAEMNQGYDAFTKGSDYSESCKIADKLEKGR
jgi:hypothetical protein